MEMKSRYANLVQSFFFVADFGGPKTSLSCALRMELSGLLSSRDNPGKIGRVKD